MDEHAVAQAQTEASMKGHAIYQVPVVLVPGGWEVWVWEESVGVGGKYGCGWVGRWKVCVCGWVGRWKVCVCGWVGRWKV